MWWRRCKTAHKLVTTFATCFVTLATSCKILEVLVNNFNPFLIVIRRKENEKKKLLYSLNKLNYCTVSYSIIFIINVYIK